MIFLTPNPSPESCLDRYLSHVVPTLFRALDADGDGVIGQAEVQEGIKMVQAMEYARALVCGRGSALVAAVGSPLSGGVGGLGRVVHCHHDEASSKECLSCRFDEDTAADLEVSPHMPIFICVPCVFDLSVKVHTRTRNLCLCTLVVECLCSHSSRCFFMLDRRCLSNAATQTATSPWKLLLTTFEAI